MASDSSHGTVRVGMVDYYPKHGGGYSSSGERKEFDSKMRRVLNRMGESDYRFTTKVVFVGDSNVGKTCLIARLCDNAFQDGYKATIGVSFRSVEFLVLGHRLGIHLWDTAGQSRFRTLSKVYYRGMRVCMICFDLGLAKDLDNVREWHHEVMDQTDPGETVFLFLVGCKSDMFHSVTYDQGEALAKELKAEYWEVSAKDGTNVKEMFERIAAVTFEHSVNTSQMAETINARKSVKIEGPIDIPESEDKGCCSLQ